MSYQKETHHETRNRRHHRLGTLAWGLAVNGPRCDACWFYDGRGGDRGTCGAASLTRDSRLYIDAWALTGGWGDPPKVRAELWVAPDHYCAEWVQR